MEDKILKGITWAHSRGITPLLAASQRFGELFPGTEIQWTKRSLQQFADWPIEKLTEQYDLLIIDHPWVGCAAATGCVLPLDEFLSPKFLADQDIHSTGNSHRSYNYNGHQWALAIDAATPAASFRDDLLSRNSTIPKTWPELISMAKKGRVAVPAIPIDLLMNFYMFCIAHGNKPFQNDEEVIDNPTGIKALSTMHELYSLVDRRMFGFNPIQVAELMTTTNDFWYCPFAYCYSNYSRPGYAQHLLKYTDLVTFNGRPLQSTIGGTGIAVSAFTKHTDTAMQFLTMVAGSTFQSTFYMEHGGQPGHRSAWESEHANNLTNQFFQNVLPVMERGYTRPRYNGYLYFQDHAGDLVSQFLQQGGNAALVLSEMNLLYQKSKAPKLQHQL